MAHPRSKPPTSAGGFTLLELLLVMLIIGILAGTVVANFGGAGQRQQVRAEAERLALAIEMARNAALQRNELWGLAAEEHGYSFQRYDPDAQTWLPVDRRPFASYTLADEVAMTMRTTFAPGRSEALQRLTEGDEADDDEDAPPPPDIAIHPGGEVTPFDAAVSGDDDAPTWVAYSDGIQRVRAVPESSLDGYRRRAPITLR